MNDLQPIPLTQRDVNPFLAEDARIVVLIHYEKPRRGGHHWFTGIFRHITLNEASCSLRVNPFFSFESHGDAPSLHDTLQILHSSNLITGKLIAAPLSSEQKFELRNPQKHVSSVDVASILTVGFDGGTVSISSREHDYARVVKFIEIIASHENHQVQLLMRDLLKKKPTSQKKTGY